MYGTNEEEAATTSESGPRWNDTSNIDLVVVGVENDSEYEPASLVVQRVLDEGQNVPMRLPDNGLEKPVWFDEQKFRKGQRYFYKNYFAMFVAKLGGLLCTLSIPTVLKILILTGKSSTPAKAYRRYMDTISNMLEWYSGNLSKRDNDIYKVLISVRGKHCAAAKKAVTSGKGNISQRDLALTLFGFMGLAVMKKEYYGIRGSTTDVEGFIHFWRIIGYFMGIDDRFNICSGSVNQVTEVCTILAENFFKPLMENPTEEFIEMSDALLNGVRPLIPFNNNDAYFEFTKRNLNVKPAKLSAFYARFAISVLEFTHTVLLATWWLAFIFRPILNVLLKLSIFANRQKYPLLAMFILGKEVCSKHPFVVKKETQHQVRMAMTH